jgi:hypothetical protein
VGIKGSEGRIGVGRCLKGLTVMNNKGINYRNRWGERRYAPISSTSKPHHDIPLQGGSVNFFMQQIKASTPCSGEGYTSCSSHISVICQQQTLVPSSWRPYLLPTHPHPLLFPPLLMYCTTSILSHFFLYLGDESGSFLRNISKFLPCYYCVIIQKSLPIPYHDNLIPDQVNIWIKSHNSGDTELPVNWEWQSTIFIILCEE